MIAIIDYDAGNIGSVIKAIEYLGERCILTRERDVILSSDKVILPGVGSYRNAIEKLNRYDLVQVIREVAESGQSLLGICLGLQLLFDTSEEAEGTKGIGILRGSIKKIPDINGNKVPHMGWNSLEVCKESRLLHGIGAEPYVYFVHSYYLEAQDSDIVVATTSYGINIHSVIENKNIYATQFHPEKSSFVGLQILKNYIAI